MKCWGYNGNGQLGDGTTTERDTPVDVTGLSSGVAAISAGEDHTCAVTTAGGAKCWGANFLGQLGDGTTMERDTPVHVTGLSSGVAAISAGNGYTCALTTAGGAKCWGSNSYGQLGDDTTMNSTTPVDVWGLSSGVAAISAGDNHSCVLTTDDGLKCWGVNYTGQLGDGTGIGKTIPVTVWGFAGTTANVYQPDAQIAADRSGPYAGDNVYNTSGLNQTESATITVGSSVSFWVHLQNDGNALDSFFLLGTKHRKGFAVHYFRGTTNITEAVAQGSYWTSVASGGTVSYRIHVGATSAATTGSSISVRLLVEAAGNSMKLDAVLAVVSV